MRTALRVIRRLLFASALLALGYCGFVLVDERIYQRQELTAFEQLRHGSPQSDSVSVKNFAPGLPDEQPPTAAGGLIGRIDIPRLDVSVMVAEGTSNTTLRRAVGHISGMALPGQPGNVGLAGHRDTFFRPLRNIRNDDLITITTVLGTYSYRVLSAKVVKPDDVTVLESGTGEVLTLVTCYPFYLVGSAPDRFIVRAERIMSAEPGQRAALIAPGH